MSETPFKVGDWTVWRDSPEFGCTDNPSYDWMANKINNQGHKVLTLQENDLTVLIEGIRNADA